MAGRLLAEDADLERLWRHYAAGRGSPTLPQFRQLDDMLGAIARLLEHGDAEAWGRVESAWGILCRGVGDDPLQVTREGGGAASRVLPFAGKNAPPAPSSSSDPARAALAGETASISIEQRFEGDALPFGEREDPLSRHRFKHMLSQHRQRQAQAADAPALAAFGPRPDPPARIGPLAHIARPPAPQAVAEPAETSEVAAPQLTQPRGEPECSLEICAAIAADVDWRRTERAAILARFDMQSKAFDDAYRHYVEVMEEEALGGKAELLGRYDGAYVAAIERRRGHLRADEYARLLVAVERGSEHAMLDELSLPRAALLRVQRVYLQKMTRDASFGAHVRTAVNAARDE
jgi:hypothetical protein